MILNTAQKKILSALRRYPDFNVIMHCRQMGMSTVLEYYVSNVVRYSSILWIKNSSERELGRRLFDANNAHYTKYSWKRFLREKNTLYCQNFNLVIFEDVSEIDPDIIRKFLQNGSHVLITGQYFAFTKKPDCFPQSPALEPQVTKIMWWEAVPPSVVERRILSLATKAILHEYYCLDLDRYHRR